MATRIYSAPRRYDLFTALIATAAFALLYAVFKAVGAATIAVVVVSALLISVAFAQALFFGGRKPRLASVLMGASLWSVVATFLVAYDRA